MLPSRSQLSFRALSYTGLSDEGGTMNQIFLFFARELRKKKKYE
jgi:hypothetical protein